MKKLLQIQTELKAPKNQYNSFGKYKYRNQEDILEALKPLLKKYECGLSLTDEVKIANSIVYIEATATFTDGEKETTVKAQAGIDPNRKGMDISQSFGSSSSYARKYALNGLFLIDDTKDADFMNKHDSNTELDKVKIELEEHNNYQELHEKRQSIRDDLVKSGMQKKEATMLVAQKLESLQ